MGRESKTDDDAGRVYQEIIKSVLVLRWRNSRSAGKLGAAIIWSEKGIIVTNCHLIEDAGDSEIIVTFIDGTRCDKVQVLVKFEDLDLAFLRIEAPRHKLKSIPYDDSNNSYVGQKVLALGHPHGFKYSLTSGCVSGLNRSVKSVVTGAIIKGMLQFDAVIHRGSSGGPLINSQGKLIGIITSYEEIGTGFAIEVKTVKQMSDKIMGSQNDASPNLPIGSLPNQSAGSGRVHKATSSTKETRPSLGIKSSQNHPHHANVGHQGHFHHSHNDIYGHQSKSVEHKEADTAEKVLRNFSQTKPMRSQKHGCYPASSRKVVFCTDGGDKSSIQLKLAHPGHSHLGFNDVVRYLLEENDNRFVGYMDLESLRLNGVVKMPNGNVIVCLGICKKCNELEFDILPSDHKVKSGHTHLIVVDPVKWNNMMIFNVHFQTRKKG